MRRTLALLLVTVPAALCAGTAPSFLPALTCALCHSRIPPPEDGSGASIAPAALWGGSMMAHASRDPYWKAKVAAETALTPSAGAAIEEKCLRCHAPAAEVAGEGVTCTVCHQIARGNLGHEESFGGGFAINTQSEIYGPHRDPFQMPMLHHTGYLATESAHMADAALCGTCHTVLIGEFLEQAPYLEWLASDWAKSGTTCQQCHMPRLGQPQYIAHNPMGRWFPPTRPRTPFGQHYFAGANVPMLDLLAASAAGGQDTLGRTSAKARENLRAALDLSASATVEGGALRVRVDLRNRTGHKLPTGFPSRRVWLHVQALSAAGAVLFESGAWDGTGAVRGAGAFEPHRARITRGEQVAIYQAVPGDSAGRPTTSLLRAVSYRKDNRILPAGFDAARDSRLAPAGVSGDGGFRPGAHRVEYEIALRRGTTPERVRVEAVYQSVDPAWLPGSAAPPLRAATLPIVMSYADVSLKSAK